MYKVNTYCVSWDTSSADNHEPKHYSVGWGALLYSVIQWHGTQTICLVASVDHLQSASNKREEEKIDTEFFRFLTLGNDTLFLPIFHWKQLINMASRVRHFIYWC